MILHRLGRLLGAALLFAPSLALGQSALQQPSVAASPGVTVDPLPTALTKLYQNDLFLQNLVTSRFSTLGAAALLERRTVGGTVADGGALTAEVTRAKAAESVNASAIANLAPINSPALTGIPTAPTAAVGTSNTQIANMAAVAAAVASGGQASVLYTPQTLTGSQQSQARGNIAAAASGANADITSLNAPSSGATALTAPAGAATAQVANAAFVANAVAAETTRATTAEGTKAAKGANTDITSLASPALGSATATTQAANDNSTKVATTAYADRAAANVRAPSFRNRIINGNFAINQRGAASASTAYVAGAYVMDRWKAGSGGVTLSFSTASNGDVTVTITAGTLLQIIEGGLYLPEGGSYVASWQEHLDGAGLCRSSLGSYVAAPLNVGPPAGANTTVEFSTGTLSLVQFEPGTAVTPFERRDDEIRRCQRYFGIYTGRLQSVAVSAANQYVPLHLGFGAQMRPGTIGVGATTSATAGSATSYVYVASDQYGADVALGLSAVNALSSATVTLTAANEL